MQIGFITFLKNNGFGQDYECPTVGLSYYVNITYKNMYNVQCTILYISINIITMKIRHLLLKVYLNYIILIANNGFGIQN